VLDVDTTLAGVEGIDWLARRRGEPVTDEVRAMTERAMRGEVPLDAVYGERLALIRPSRADVEALALAYEAHVAPGALETLTALRAAGVRAVLVSGGIRQAIAPMALALGFTDGALHAVDVRFDAQSAYAGFDESSPLTTQAGKPRVVRGLALPRPVLAVGDGSTDAAMRPAVDAFAAYVGFVRREPVVRAADLVIDSFHMLREVVLP
jgi:phosphoserine phosphatase